jgi:hypothetical protein
VAAGVSPRGKRGPHAFRHGVAVSMLRAAVVPTTKSIGLPIALHRTSRATRVRVPDRNGSKVAHLLSVRNTAT